MSKVLQSPSKRWPGSISIPTYLTLPQVMAWRAALDKAAEFVERIDDERITITNPQGYYLAMLDVCCSLVEKWELAGLGHLTSETFPGTPAAASLELARFVVTAFADLISGEDELPKG